MNCLRAARGVSATVLDAHTGVDLEAHIVWIDVLASDTAEDALTARKVIDDPRALHYHDPARHIGRALGAWAGIDSMASIAEGLGVDPEALTDRFKRDYLFGGPCLFDSIFFFGPDAEWKEEPPVPLGWATQLDATTYTGFDPGRSFWGEALNEELARLARLHFAPPEEESAAPAQDPGGE